MSRALNDLDPRFRPVAFELLARFTEASLCIMVVDTLRTPAEHARNLANGVSWIQHSKHLDGLAIDVVPYREWLLHGANKVQWDGSDPVWQHIGAVGEALGLRWGGRWQQHDLGHFELVTR